MTTIKEYKAMMEGATDARILAVSSLDKLFIYGRNLNSSDAKSLHSDVMRYIYADISPSLIRVIELAEEVLNICPIYANNDGVWLNSRVKGSCMIKIPEDAEEHFRKVYEKYDEALSEIRKLRGE